MKLLFISIVINLTLLKFFFIIAFFVTQLIARNLVNAVFYPINSTVLFEAYFIHLPAIQYLYINIRMK